MLQFSNIEPSRFLIEPYQFHLPQGYTYGQNQNGYTAYPVSKRTISISKLR